MYCSCCYLEKNNKKGEKKKAHLAVEDLVRLLFVRFRLCREKKECFQNHFAQSHRLVSLHINLNNLFGNKLDSNKRLNFIVITHFLLLQVKYLEKRFVFFLPSSAFFSHSTNFFICSRKTLLPLERWASEYHFRMASSLNTSAVRRKRRASGRQTLQLKVPEMCLFKKGSLKKKNG